MKPEIIGVERHIEKSGTGISALNLRKEQINEIFKKMRAARNLDLCFLVDVTAGISMEAHIAGVKNSIRNIVDKLTTKPAVVGTQPIVRMVSQYLYK